MKRWRLVVAIIGLLVVGMLGARHFTERARQATNVRHDASNFTNALKTGNERAVANYLALPKTDFEALDMALRTHAQALLRTDFDSAPVRFHTSDSTLFATFECVDQAELIFYTEDSGDVWRVAEIKPHQ
ncbi:hypothetical protein [Haloferula sp.]|uniref:hypothetical protein n=1 Tax=Haloferula sp. TaxID=2497595 RepID=UPI00329EBB22